MVIAGLQKTSLIDYPKKISAVIFTQGCNFKCHYCHNPELIRFKKTSVYDPKAVLEFLYKRKKQLDGVVFTGGEPTLQPDLADYLMQIKKMGYDIKLDTNGSNPAVIKTLTKEKLIDYIAMDIKAPLKRYFDITQVKTDIEKIKQSIRHIFESTIEHEFRTTIAKTFLKIEDILGIGQFLSSLRRQGSKIENITYSLQNFRNTGILNPAFAKSENYTDGELSILKSKLNKYIKNINIR